jgi:hypothetical protein
MSSPQPRAARTFSVLKFKPFEKNTHRGFLSLELSSGMILHDVTLHVHANGSRWVGVPGRPYEKAAGEKTWTPIVEFASKEASDRFRDAALEAIDAYTQEGRV